MTTVYKELRLLDPGRDPWVFMVKPPDRWYQLRSWWSHWRTIRWVRRQVQRALAGDNNLVRLTCPRCEGMATFMVIETVAADDAIYLRQVGCSVEGCK